MPEFTRDQTGRYLEHLLSYEEALLDKPLTSSQIDRIYDETLGLPGHIKRQALKLIGLEKKPPQTANLNNSLSSKTIIGGGLAVITLLLILVFQDDINAIFSGEKAGEDTAKTERLVQDGYRPLVIPESEKDLSLESEISAKEPLAQPAPGDIEVVDGEQADLGPVTDNDKLDSGMEKEKSALEQDNQALKAQHERSEPEQGAIQPPIEKSAPKVDDKPVVESSALAGEKAVTGSTPTEKIEASNEKLPDKSKKVPEKLNSVEPKVSTPAPQKKSQPKQKAAEVKKQSKPVEEQVKKIEPTVKTAQKTVAPPVQPVTNDSQKSELTKTTKPVNVTPSSIPKVSSQSLPAPVEDRSTVLAKTEVPAVKVTGTSNNQNLKQQVTKAAGTTTVTTKSTRGRFYREAWLLKQKPSSYTIQLVGLQDEKGIAGFISRHSVDGPVAYYRTLRNGKPWFPVLYGAYSTRGRAVAARDKLPKSLINSGVWLRSLGSVQKDIRAR
jgi:DamX protein